MILPGLADKGFEIRSESHAIAILERDFPGALNELEGVLLGIEIPITEIIGSGGGETKVTQRMRRALTDLGWRKGKFHIEKTVNVQIKKTIHGVQHQSRSHEIDHVKVVEGNHLVLEIEWNNKDPFFDRDLENFKRLHAEGAVSAGIIVTRGSSLQQGMWKFVNQFALKHNINSFADLKRCRVGITPKQIAAIERRTVRDKKPVDFCTAWTDKFVGDKFGEATTHWQKLLDRISRGVGSPCPLLLIGLPHSIVTGLA